MASVITGCVSITAFASLLGIPIGITGSAIGFKICIIAAGIKQCKPITKKKNKKHEKIVLLTKSKLNSIEALISKALTDSNISHEKFVLINRSSRPDVFCKKGVLRNFAKFLGKHLYQSLFFIEVAGGACNFTKKDTLAQVFSCEFCETFKSIFSYWTPPVAASEIRNEMRAKEIIFSPVPVSYF